MVVNNYDEALEFIHGRTQFKKIPTLKRMQYLLEKLGNPHVGGKFIHVTGTNGKGSTTAYLRDLIKATGYSVGTFTSPFIQKFNERIAINGNMISDEDLLELARIIEPIVNKMDEDEQSEFGGPTEFEIITAMMFLYFKQQAVDYAVIEVGIGGKFDSTNVLTPILSVITNVRMDHNKILGDTLKEIAFQKSGIIKNNQPTILGDILPKPKQVLLEAAQQKNSLVYEMGQEFIYKKTPTRHWGEKFSFHGMGYDIQKIKISMQGQHQVKNAALAIAAFIKFAEMENIEISTNLIKDAIEKTNWQGRLELVNQEPLIVLDGAHNLAAIQEIKKVLREKFFDREIYVIISILEDKAADEMIAELLTLKNVHLVVTTFNAHRKVTNLKYLKEKFPNVRQAKSWQEALLEVTNLMSMEDMILFTGSLYFISEVRKYFK